MRRVTVHGPYKHGKKWRVHFVTVSGDDRSTEYETFASRAAAQACVDGARDEAQGITVSAAIDAFIAVRRAQGRAELTIVAYDGRLRLLLADYLTRPVRSIQHRGAELYTGALDGRSADSHRNLLIAGSMWGKFCVKQRWLKGNPFAEVEPVGQRVHGADKVRLTTDESRKLEAWCLARPNNQDAVLTLGYLYLGPRNTELSRRCVRDLDDDGSVLVIGKTKSKNGRRRLRIPTPLVNMLRIMCAGRAGDEPIFHGGLGKQMTSEYARKTVRRACKAAGVTVVPPQALRRTQASLATEAGETSLAVARHLGDTLAVAESSYIERGTADAAQVERAFRVIRGGRS